MIRPARYSPAIALLCSTAVATAQPDSINSSQSAVRWDETHAVAAGIFPGRIDGCAINPPLALFSENVTKSTEGGDYLLKPKSASDGAVTVAAFASEVGVNDGRPVTLIVDRLAVADGQLRSETGETWEVFGAAKSVTTPSGTRLVAKRADYSVCRLAHAVVITGFPTTGYTAAIAAQIGAIASASTVSRPDILGLRSNSYVRLRLRSSPSEADIFLDGIRQPPRTDTILDVIAAVIPRIRIQKEGYEPCSLGRRNLAFEDKSRRVVSASCELIPKKRKNRR